MSDSVRIQQEYELRKRLSVVERMIWELVKHETGIKTSKETAELYKELQASVEAHAR